MCQPSADIYTKYVVLYIFQEKMNKYTKKGIVASGTLKMVYTTTTAFKHNNSELLTTTLHNRKY